MSRVYLMIHLLALCIENANTGLDKLAVLYSPYTVLKKKRKKKKGNRRPVGAFRVRIVHTDSFNPLVVHPHKSAL